MPELDEVTCSGIRNFCDTLTDAMNNRLYNSIVAKCILSNERPTCDQDILVRMLELETMQTFRFFTVEICDQFGMHVSGLNPFADVEYGGFVFY